MACKNTRQFWIQTLLDIANPVFGALASGNLRKQMPVECNVDPAERANYTHLEAVGRSLAGIGPWLNLQAVSGDERMQQARLTELVCTSLQNATDKQSADFLNFADGQQPIVDAAFLAQGLLRSWDGVWMKLNAETQERVISCLMLLRDRKPPPNNWLLFSATIEAFLFKAGAAWDPMRVDYAIRQHEQWYKGDGMYGDGPWFHWDYYNSYVIQPMLYDIIHVGGELSDMWKEFKEPICKRIQRYAAVLERMIAPDGSFPPIGRSLTYRMGAFQALAVVALKSELPPEMSPASVRCALTAMMQKTMDMEGTFDEQGWLRIGLCGYQPSLGERYISTGSLYLCLCGLLPLGLSEEDPFWADPDVDWTSRRIWNGEDFDRDYAIQY